MSLRTVAMGLCALSLLASLAAAQEPRPRRPRGAGPPSATAPAAPAESPQASLPPKVEAGPITAFVGATLWTVSGPPIEEGTLLVQDGKILAVGRGLTVPEGAKVHDVRGMHMAPGFIALNSRGALGVRGVSTTERAADVVDPFTDTMLLCLSAGITTAHEALSTGGALEFAFGGRGAGTFSGTSQGLLGGVVAKLTYGTIDGFMLRDPAGVYFDLGMASAARHQELRSALEKAKNARKERREWIQKLVQGDKEAKEPRADDPTKAIIRVMEGELPGFIHGNTRLEIERVIALSEEFDIPFVMTGAEEAWILASEIGRADIRAMISPRGRGGMMASTRPYRERFVEADHGWSVGNAKALEAAGVPWGTMPMEPTYSLGGLAGRDLAALPLDAAFAVRGGAAEAAALRSITLGAAEILGVADRIGSLEVGKDADFLVMDRDPLDYRSLIEQAWVNGRRAYDREEAGIWSHLRKDRSTPPGEWRPYGIWGRFPSREEVLKLRGLKDAPVPVPSPESR